MLVPEVRSLEIRIKKDWWSYVHKPFEGSVINSFLPGGGGSISINFHYLIAVAGGSIVLQLLSCTCYYLFITLGFCFCISIFWKVSVGNRLTLIHLAGKFHKEYERQQVTYGFKSIGITALGSDLQKEVY